MFELQLDKNVSTDHVVHGCFVSFVVMTLSMLLASLIFAEWLGWWTAEGEKALSLGVWLIAICLGGYVAARRSQQSGFHSFRTALWVGALATLLVLVKLPEPRQGADFIDQLTNVVLHPVAQWRHSLRLLLTIPAALFGWLIASRLQGAH
jgi:hypothetical protein